MTAVAGRRRRARRARAQGRPAGGWKTFRTILFWCHLTVGTVAGIVVVVMSVTGVALMYQRQVLAWTASRHRVAPPAAAERLPLDTLFARVQAGLGERRIVSVAVAADPAMPVSMAFADRRTLFVDPYTARVAGSDSAPRAFFTGMERWHRSLALGPSMRSKVGTAITGASNLAFLFLILSGLYLWLPKRWSAQAVRTILFWDRTASGKARDWNWHHVAGIWTAPVLILVVATGAFISYAWPTKLMTRLVNGRAPAEARGPGGSSPRGEGARPAERGGGQAERGEPEWVIGTHASLDTLWSRAARQTPGWQTIQLRLPRTAGGPVALSISTGSTGRPTERSQLSLDATTAAVVERQTYDGYDRARQLRSWVRPLHTGEAGGPIGQTIAGLASAAGALLVWTGLALAWRRLRARLARRRSEPVLAQSAAPPPAA